MIGLRGHHLICLHFFSGEGYDDIFRQNLNSVLSRTGSEEIGVCENADEVCKKCPYLKDSRCLYDNNADAEIRKMDVTAMDLLGVGKDSRMRWQELKDKITLIFPRWHREYCGTCDWKNVCEKNESYRRLEVREG